MLIVLSVILFLPGAALSATRIAADDVKTAISDYVEKNHPWPSGNVRVHFQSKISDAVFPQDSVTIEVSGRPEEDFIENATFMVGLYVGKSLIQQMMVRVILEVLTDVVVSNRALTRNREIAAEDVRVLKRWVRRIPANVVTMPSEVIGKVLTMNLNQNSEITKNILRTPLLIKRKSVVRITLENDNLSVTTMGISEEDGAADKIIRVKNLSSNRTIYAKVIGDSLVRVEY
ncbi:MAG: flagellar basal body P-ring formation chaperone FlgA [Deltaproteobacteria bacterium]|nr:flagellar basal body P-ring formation chaperone FlgA [Deltaproteobacteria bacterium]